VSAREKDLCIRAGDRAREMIMDGGFSLDAVRTYVGPAVGPRWLVASGFDLTLMKNDLLGRQRPVLLAGASAGAWRFAAWIQPEREKSHLALREAYITATYSRRDTPATVRASLASIIDRAVEDDAVPFALADGRHRLAVTTARAKNLAAAFFSPLQRLGFYAAFALNALDRRFLNLFVEPVVFYTGPKPPPFTLLRGFEGRHFPLTEINFKTVLVATAAIPLVVEGVRDIYGAPYGVYRDGGLTDYHLARDYGGGEDGVTLLFHHQDRIVPGWLDRRLKRRSPPREALSSLLMVHPSPELVASLPLGKVPERDDFVAFMDRPGERIENWRLAVERTSHLGEVFCDLIESGRIRDVLLPLATP